MMKVQDDILHVIDGNKAVVLLMLNLSASFDTVSHEILLDRLSQRYGFTGSVQEWFASYLSSQLFKLNVQDLLYVNLIVVYRRGLFLGLSYMFCTLHQWLIS